MYVETNIESNAEWVLDAEIDDYDLHTSLTSSTDLPLILLEVLSESSNCISNSKYANDYSNSCHSTSSEVAMNIDISSRFENIISNSEPNIDSVDPASHGNIVILISQMM